MRIQIKKVDMNGFCGRENHPEKSDEGKVCRVLWVESEAYIGCKPISKSEIEYTPELSKDPEYYVVVIYHVITDDSKETPLEILDHEMEVFCG